MSTKKFDASKKIHVICEPKKGLKMLGVKLKIPNHLTVGHLQQAVRKRTRNLKPEEALYLFVNDKHLIPMTRNLTDLIKEHGIDDTLYVSIYAENTFGC